MTSGGHAPGRLFAPWRADYVQGRAAGGETCPFCQLAAAPPDRFRSLGVLAAGEHSLGGLNRYPYQAGHVLICPRRHVARLPEVPAICRREMDHWMV